MPLGSRVSALATIAPVAPPASLPSGWHQIKRPLTSVIDPRQVVATVDPLRRAEALQILNHFEP